MFSLSEKNNRHTTQRQLSRKPGETFFNRTGSFFNMPVQAKPTADKVMRSAATGCPDAVKEEDKLSRKEEDKLQAKGNAAPEVSNDFEQHLQGSKGGGSPLPGDVKQQMETGIGADFSNVRIHTGPQAAQLSNSIQAQAFTHGSDIYFNEGKYSPGTNGGRHLLAHELTHTVQQGASATQVQRQETPTAKFDVDKAVTALNNNAQPGSQSACATYVRMALEAGGFNTAGHPRHAYQYKNYLMGKGFTEVVSAQKGDIVVIEPIKGHPSGHIAMYNGTQWVSDFKQRTLMPGKDYRAVNPPYVILR